MKLEITLNTSKRAIMCTITKAICVNLVIEILYNADRINVQVKSRRQQNGEE